MSKTELYSNCITKRRRTYFFDISKAENERLYLQIVESKKIDDGFERNSIMIFEEDDNKLEMLFCQGKNIHELAQIFERKEGAISSRIKKLELREKYNINIEKNKSHDNMWDNIMHDE